MANDTYKSPYSGAQVDDAVGRVLNGTAISVDTSLSTSSTNPVQNKVVAAALNDKANSSEVHSVPPGGYSEEVLVKSANTNYKTKWKKMPISDTGDADIAAGYYKSAGVTISDSGCPAFGFITDNRATLNLTIFMQKAIPYNAAVNITKLCPIARTVDGKYVGASSWTAARTYDISGDIVTGRVWHINGGIMVECYNENGYTNTTNNSIIVGYCTIELTYTVPSDRFEISNVASYLQSETLSVADEVNNLSDDWESFAFITDMHGSANKNNSQNIGLYLLDNAKISMLVLAGDYSLHEWNQSEYETYMAPYLSSKSLSQIYAMYGNHEHWGGFNYGSLQKVYEDFQQSKTGLNGMPAKGYWYIDDLDKKIRFMFINTSDQAGSSYTMSTSQINWISENAVLPDSSWSLLVLGHVNLVKMAGVTTDNEVNGAAVVNAIKNCNGNLIGYICGHQHIDLHEIHDGVHHLTLLCDKFENTNYYDGISVTNRVSGTSSEQAVTVISVNTSTKQVVARRIGAGRNRTISYTY